MKQKEHTYMEVAEIMSSMIEELQQISNKTEKAFKIVDKLNEPKSVKEQAIEQVIITTTPAFTKAVEVMLSVIELYTKSKYVIGKNK